MHGLADCISITMNWRTPWRLSIALWFPSYCACFESQLGFEGEGWGHKVTSQTQNQSTRVSCAEFSAGLSGTHLDNSSHWEEAEGFEVQGWPGHDMEFKLYIVRPCGPVKLGLAAPTKQKRCSVVCFCSETRSHYVVFVSLTCLGFMALHLPLLPKC